MRIGLIPQLSINSLYPRYSPTHVPLGLLCIAAALDRKKHEIEIIDLVQLIRDGVIAYDKNFDEESARFINIRRFDVVGFSTFSASYHHSLNINSRLKKLSPNVITILGGPQASFCDVETMGYFPVDYIVRGEGEISFANLIDALERSKPPSGIAGITYRQSSNVKRNDAEPFIEDIDTLPFPAYDLYPIRKETNVPIEATRGCPFSCTFCATSRYWGHRVRHKGAPRIFSEMEFLRKKYPVEILSFTDDTFTLDRAKVTRICNHFIEKKIRVRWTCSTRIDAVDERLLGLMSKAGCVSIFYGIESGSPKIQKKIRKNIDTKIILKNLKLTSKYGMGSTSSFMLGFPDETEEDLSMTLKLRNKIKLLFSNEQPVQLHLLSPDVRTEITRKNLKRLAYDGFHSDYSGGVFAPYDKDMILRHPNLFHSFYYLKMKHIDRKFIKLLYQFIFIAQILAYWSSLYIMLRNGDPLKIFKKWLKFHEAFKPPEGLPKNAPEHAMVTGSILRFLNEHLDKSKPVPPCIRDLFLHESEKTTLKGKIISGHPIAEKASEGKIISARDYHHDPDVVIRAMRKSMRAVRDLKKSPVRLEYIQRGTDDNGPIIVSRLAP